MLNANPTLAPEAAAAEVRRLHAQGFGSVRFNPYIWPAGRKVGELVDGKQADMRIGGCWWFLILGGAGRALGVCCRLCVRGAPLSFFT